MAWTNPSSYSAGNTLTAAGLNTNMVDNLRSLRQMNDRACKLRLDVSDQTISSGTFTALNWQAADWNFGSMWSSAANASRVTPKEVGFYSFSGTIFWQDSSVGIRAITLERNGTQRFTLSKQGVPSSGGGADSPVMSFYWENYVSSTADYYTLLVWHSGAGTLDIRSHTITGTVFSVRLLGTT